MNEIKPCKIIATTDLDDGFVYFVDSNQVLWRVEKSQLQRIDVVCENAYMVVLPKIRADRK